MISISQAAGPRRGQVPIRTNGEASPSFPTYVEPDGHALMVRSGSRGRVRQVDNHARKSLPIAAACFLPSSFDRKDRMNLFTLLVIPLLYLMAMARAVAIVLGLVLGMAVALPLVLPLLLAEALVDFLLRRSGTAVPALNEAAPPWRKRCYEYVERHGF